MHKAIRMICLASAAYVVAIHDGLAQANNTNDSRLPMYGQIEHQMAVFETNKSVEIVKQINDSAGLLETIPFNDRKEHARTWLQLLTMIDNNVDPHFDIRAIDVLWYVTPPPDGTNGMRYQPGVPPEMLKDPEARSNYVAAIRENEEKGKKAHLQGTLLSLSARANSCFEKFLRSAYTSSDADKKEIREIINQLKASSAYQMRMIQYCRLVLGSSTN